MVEMPGACASRDSRDSLNVHGLKEKRLNLLLDFGSRFFEIESQINEGCCFCELCL
jgi:hypothetical protein